MDGSKVTVMIVSSDIISRKISTHAHPSGTEGCIRSSGFEIGSTRATMTVVSEAYNLSHTVKTSVLF